MSMICGSRFKKLRFGGAMLLGVLISSSHPYAHSQISSDAFAGRLELSSYRTLFRRVLLYSRLADEADVVHAPKPHLRNITSTRFNLTSEGAFCLNQYALSYEREAIRVHAQVLQATSNFHHKFAHGSIPSGTDATPPAELAILQAADDELITRHRDLLRNCMQEAEFVQLHQKVLAAFGGSSK